TAGRGDIFGVYKNDRVAPSLAAFSQIVEILGARGGPFFFVTQQFNNATPMGGLPPEVLLFFWQFLLAGVGDRIHAQDAASKRKGMWMGGGAAAWLSGAKRQAHHRRRRGGNRAHDLLPLCRTRLGAVVEGRAKPGASGASCGRAPRAASRVASHSPAVRS